MKNRTVGADSISAQKGITLIALVITIIVLLILSGIVLNLTIGKDGLITKAKEAKRMQEIAQIKERLSLEILSAESDAIIRNESLEKRQLEDIINKYGTLQEDGDTIITKEKQYEISLKEIWYGVLSESGSYTDKVEQIEILEKELADLQEKYKELEEINSGNSEVLEELKNQIIDLENRKTTLENEKIALEESLNNAQKKVADLENLNQMLAKTTVTSDKILKGYTAYKDGKLITGTMENRRELRWEDVNANGGQVQAGYYSGGDLSKVEQTVYKSLYGAGTKRYTYNGFNKAVGYNASSSSENASVTYTVPITHLPNDENTVCMMNILAATISAWVNRGSASASFVATTDNGKEIYRTAVSTTTQQISLNLFAYDVAGAESITFTISGWCNAGDFAAGISASNIYVDYLIPKK